MKLPLLNRDPRKLATRTVARARRAFEAATPRLAVAGAFRSGTNLAKHLLELNFEVEVMFSRWSWKHMPPPTLVGEEGHAIPDCPIIVVTRHPLTLNPALYDFWGRRRPELDRGASLSEFIRKEFIVYDSTFGGKGPHYMFPTPTDYWSQFHYAYCHWRAFADRIAFVRYEAMAADPDAALGRVAERFRVRRRNGRRIELPAESVLPSSDARGASLGETFKARQATLSQEDRAFIIGRMHPAVMARLGYDAPGTAPEDAAAAASP